MADREGQEDVHTPRPLTPKEIAAVGITLVLISFAIVMGLGTTSADIVSYGNTSEVTVYATDIFGIWMAWVHTTWTFAYDETLGQFELGQNSQGQQNTFFVAVPGSNWPDSASITRVYTSSTVYELYAQTGFQFSSPLNQITGTVFNEVTANAGNIIMIYYGTDSIINVWTGPLPVSFEVDID